MDCIHQLIAIRHNARVAKVRLKCFRLTEDQLRQLYRCIPSFAYYLHPEAYASEDVFIEYLRAGNVYRVCGIPVTERGEKP
jgi:hypothetical protein